jgi:hypothetical protein
MNASIPNTRPKVMYQPVLGMSRPVTRTSRVYAETLGASDGQIWPREISLIA